jgi:polar amino acid transport system substrate-binding protein
MKQVQQNYRSGQLKVSEVPAPRVPSGGLLVATTASLISSGTEKQLIDLAKSSLVGKAMARPDLVRRVVRNVQREGLKPTIEKVFAKLDMPIPLGYSIAGRVIEVARDCQGFAVGDRVACAGAGIASHAEINAVPKNLALRIPDGVDDQDAAFVTLGAIALQGVRQAQLTLGERVVVMGLGLIGLLTVQLLKASGCRVLGFDPNPERAKLAQEIGADIAVSEGLADAVAGFTAGYGADAVIITASTKSSDPLNVAAEVSRLKGRIVIVGLVGMTIDREPFYRRELDVRLSFSYGPGRHDPDYEQAGHDYPLPYVRWTEQRNMSAFLDFVAEGRVTPKALVTHTFDISRAEDAYTVMERGESHLAMLLSYPGAGPASVLVRRIERRPISRKATNRVGFIGLGNYAKGVLLPALSRQQHVELAAVATATGISSGNSAEKYDFAIAATDPSAILSDPAIDTVFIATRHHSHAGFAAEALAAGKHVFCEKPLALSRDELTNVTKAAETAGGVLTVGFNRRFAPLLLKAKAALEPRSGPVVMLYRVNAGSIPRESWIQGTEGGGRIVGEVCHFVDALTFLSNSLPIEAGAIAARGQPDAVSILLRFADGSTGTIVYSSLGDPSVPKEYLEVFAAGRVVQLQDFHELVVTRGSKRSVVRAAQDKGQGALIASFLRATRGEAPPPIPLEELEAVTAATFAIEESLSSSAACAVAGEQTKS